MSYGMREHEIESVVHQEFFAKSLGLTNAAITAIEKAIAAAVAANNDKIEQDVKTAMEAFKGDGWQR